MLRPRKGARPRKVYIRSKRFIVLLMAGAVPADVNGADGVSPVRFEKEMPR